MNQRDRINIISSIQARKATLAERYQQDLTVLIIEEDAYRGMPDCLHKEVDGITSSLETDRLVDGSWSLTTCRYCTFQEKFVSDHTLVKLN